MNKRIISIVLLLLLVIMLCSCGKDKNNENVSVVTTNDGENVDDNPDAWWQQYTTEPSPNMTNNNSTTKKSGKSTAAGSSNKTTGNSNSSKTTAASHSSSANSANEDYIKVDADTMKYDVRDGNDTGTVTLSKSPSNTYIKQTLSAVNSAFGTNFSAANTMCFSSTLPSMKSTNLVFIFDGNTKSKDTLKFVVQFENNSPVTFVTMTADGKSVPFDFWPCAPSGNDDYNKYLASFKQGVETKATGTYDKITNSFKNALNDSCIQKFLKW